MIIKCDEKLRETVKKLDIYLEALSTKRFILGSQIVPIINTGVGLLPFYENINTYLLKITFCLHSPFCCVEVCFYGFF